MTQSVEKAVSVLRAFVKGRPTLRVSDVAKHAGLGQSTASRTLATLESLDLVERDDPSGLYRLGPMLLTLAGTFLNQNQIYREGRQRAQDLASKLGLGVNIAIRRTSSIFYLCNFEGSNAPRSHTLMGQSNPLHATGLGKCLLLGLSEEARRDLAPDGFPRFTAYTIGTHEDMDIELDRVRKRGYAVEREELALGRACIAAPIVGADASIVAAVSISGPLSAINLDEREAELSRSAIEVADAMSSGLGYRGPALDGAISLATEPG